MWKKKLSNITKNCIFEYNDKGMKGVVVGVNRIRDEYTIMSGDKKYIVPVKNVLVI